MMVQEIVQELERLGSEGTRRVFLNHGIPEPVFGVKIGDLKTIRKRIKKDHRLALELYDTGIFEARYLAGLIAEDARMTPDDLTHWAETATVGLQGSIVPAVAAGSPHGRELALRWIESACEGVAVAGWTTLSFLVSIKNDAELDMEELRALLDRVRTTIHDQPNNVRYAMNGYVIALGCYARPLTEAAEEAAAAIGRVAVDMGKTGCKVPYAPDYIRKVRDRGTLGKKRGSVKC